MGGRLLRRWISDPLIDVKEINNRLEAVKEFKASKLPEIKNMLANAKSGMLRKIYDDLDTLDDIFQLIDKAIVDEPPILITEGGIIKMGYSPEIDELKTAMIDGKTWLVQLEAREREETGIKGLKVGYNKVFGYYLEVTKSYLSQVPDRYIRKQTLTGGENKERDPHDRRRHEPYAHVFRLDRQPGQALAGQLPIHRPLENLLRQPPHHRLRSRRYRTGHRP